MEKSKKKKMLFKKNPITAPFCVIPGISGTTQIMNMGHDFKKEINDFFFKEG